MDRKFFKLTVSETETQQFGAESVLVEQKGVSMSEYNSGNRCPECDATGGNHYPGCTYEGMGNNERYSSGSGNGMSTFGAIMCTIGGFLGVAFIFTFFDADVESIPTFVIVILLIIVTSLIAGVISAFKGK